MEHTLKKKLVSTIVSIGFVLVLICFCATTYTWYNMNRKANANMNDIKFDPGQTVAIVGDEYTVYGYDFATDRPADMQKDMELGQYNIFVPQRNTFNRRIVRMKFYYPQGTLLKNQLEVKLFCGDITVNPSSLFVKDDSGVDTDVMNKVISNFVQFKFYDNYGDNLIPEDEDATVEEIYMKAVEIFDGISDSKAAKFVNILNEENASKLQEVHAFVDMPSFAQTGTGQLQSDFFIEINYSNDLINFYKDKHAGVDFDLSYFAGGEGIKFAPDIEKIGFTLEDEE